VTYTRGMEKIRRTLKITIKQSGRKKKTGFQIGASVGQAEGRDNNKIGTGPSWKQRKGRGEAKKGIAEKCQPSSS